MAILKKLLGRSKAASKNEPRNWPKESRSDRGPIRVLLVDDDEEDYLLTRDVLEDVEEQAFDLFWAQNYEEAVAAIRSGDYDVYLLDYKLGSHTGIDLLRDELANGTKGAAILLTGVRDRDIDMQAMRGGAAGFLVKSEAGPAEMERSIRYAIEGYRAKTALLGGQGVASKSRVIAFSGVKGGCGTTSVAANVAVALADMGRNVTALDMRGDFGTFSWMLGLETAHDIGTLIASSPARIDPDEFDSQLAAHSSGLRVLAAPQSLEHYFELQARDALSVLQAASASSEFVIVDLPGGFTEINRQILQHSDIVALVMDREPSSLAAAGKAVQLLKKWEIEALMGAVVVDRVVLSSSESATWITASLDLELFRYIAAAKEVFYEAATTRSPVVDSAPSHFASQAFVELASKLASVGLNDAAAEATRELN